MYIDGYIYDITLKNTEKKKIYRGNDTRVPKHNFGLAADRLTLGSGLHPDEKNCPSTGPTTSNRGAVNVFVKRL